jgi:hypothetical protein
MHAYDPGELWDDCSWLHKTTSASGLATPLCAKDLESAQNLLADEPLLWFESLELGHEPRLNTDVSFLLISQYLCLIEDY